MERLNQDQAQLHVQLRLFGALLVTDVLAKHRSMISEDIFEAPSAMACTYTLLRLYDALGKRPGKRTFITELVRDHGSGAERAVKFAKRAFKLDPTELENLYGQELRDLIEIAHMQKRLTLALDAANNGDKEGATKFMHQASSTTEAADAGSYLESDPLTRYGKDADAQGRARKWSTGYQGYDDLLTGGFGEKELHVFFGPPGSGKSRLISNFAMHLAKQGARVDYITLELGRASVESRLDQILTGLSFNALRTKQGLKELERCRKEIVKAGGDIRTSKFYPHSIDIMRLGAYMRALDPRPNVIILDYFELLNYSGITDSGNYWEDQGRMYAIMKGFMEELHVVGIGVTQPKKGADEKIESQGAIGGSGNKVNPLDSLWSLHTIGNQITTSGRFGLYGLKNRWGAPSKRFPMKVDPVTHMKITEDFSPPPDDEQEGETKKKWKKT